MARYGDAETVVTGIVGCAGLLPTIAAISAGKDIALANKETLIAGGPVVLPLVEKHGVKLLPADSEHSAIFQCLQGGAIGWFAADYSDCFWWCFPRLACRKVSRGPGCRCYQASQLVHGDVRLQ